MRVEIETIPHSQQRYPTCGDWFYKDETLHIKVSELADWRHSALIAVHELVEVLLCKQACITQESVDQFDTKFEAARQEANEDEPGDDPSAPYVRQHCVATGVERILAAELGVNWKEYEDALTTLDAK